MWRDSVLLRQLAVATLLAAVLLGAAALPGQLGETFQHVLEDLLTTSYDSVWAHETFYSLLAEEELRPVMVPIAHRLGFAAELQHDTALAARRQAVLRDLAAPVAGLVVEPFGWQGEPPELHQGIALSATPGSPVRAAAAGEVVEPAAAAGTLEPVAGAGQLVIAHPHDLHTLYAGSLVPTLPPGTPVARGEVIGQLQGDQLTFALLVDGRAIDPAPKLVLQP